MYSSQIIPTCHSQITLPTIYKLNYRTNHSQIIKPAHKLHSLSTNYHSNHLQWNHDDFWGLRSIDAQATTYVVGLGLLHIVLTLAANEGQKF
jgi:hypothetical protein